MLVRKYIYISAYKFGENVTSKFDLVTKSIADFLSYTKPLTNWIMLIEKKSGRIHFEALSEKSIL